MKLISCLFPSIESHLNVNQRPRSATLAESDREGEAVAQSATCEARRHAGGAHWWWQDCLQKHPTEGTGTPTYSLH